MGVQSIAQLRRGFIIDFDKLPALLARLRAKESDSTPEAKKQTIGEITFEEVSELQDLLEDIFDPLHYSFTAKFGGVDWESQSIEDKHELALYVIYDGGSSAEGWGSSNYGCTISALGKDLDPATFVSEGVRDRLPALKKALYMDELGIEVEEEWLLSLNIG